MAAVSQGVVMGEFDPARDRTDLYLSFAEELADAVRPVVLSYFRTPLEVIAKLDQSPVTIADRIVERSLRQRIEARFPEHGILGEEFGIKPGNGFTWILDPIDGTKSFITGYPLFGTLVALVHDDKPFCGVIDMPAINERWTAKPGQTLFAGRAAQSSGCDNVAAARFYTTSPDMFAGREAAAFETLSRAAGLRRFGGDCYAYGLLASGHCDLVLETGLQPYDYMALVSVVQGAGGCITDWNGNALSLRSDGRVLASATPRLHDEALAIINR
jgi:histidinol-phosphatase